MFVNVVDLFLVGQVLDGSGCSAAHEPLLLSYVRSDPALIGYSQEGSARDPHILASHGVRLSIKSGTETVFSTNSNAVLIIFRSLKGFVIFKRPVWRCAHRIVGTSGTLKI